MAKQRPVYVHNACGTPWTSPEQAIKYVRQGRARVVGEWSIEMLSADHRHQAALATVSRAIERRDRPSRPRHRARFDPVHEETIDARPGLPVYPPGLNWTLHSGYRSWEEFKGRRLIS